jgi:hypothetical protein
MDFFGYNGTTSSGEAATSIMLRISMLQTSKEKKIKYKNKKTTTNSPLCFSPFLLRLIS